MNEIKDKNIINVDEMKRIQLEMMDCMHDYCVKKGIRYFLTGGALIGAVRHSGYIPWDDDIDIVMPRYDYELFISKFNKDHKGDYKVLSVDIDDNYYLPFAKMINTKTILEEDIDTNSSIGVYIDIFPLDNMGNDVKSAKNKFDKVGVARNKLLLKTVSINNDRIWYKNLILRIGKLALKSKSLHDLAYTINNLAKEKSSKDMTPYVCAVVTATYGEKEIVESELYDDRVELVFEERIYFAPIGYHRVLTSLYGDYMELPPRDKQVSHHVFKAYWKE